MSAPNVPAWLARSCSELPLPIQFVEKQRVAGAEKVALNGARVPF